MRGVFLWMMFVSLALANSTQALNLIGAEAPPFVTEHDGKPSGAAIAILQEAAQRAGVHNKIQIYPFARALFSVTENGPSLLVPLGRIPAREHQFQWVAPLIDEAFVLVGNRNINSQPLTRAQLAGKMVTVIRDSASAHLAEALPNVRVNSSTHEDSNAKILAAGRVTAWVTTWNTALQVQREAGLPEADLVKGEVLLRTTLYLAASPDLPAIEVLRWRAIIAAMKADGTLNRLLHDYHYVAP